MTMTGRPLRALLVVASLVSAATLGGLVGWWYGAASAPLLTVSRPACDDAPAPAAGGGGEAAVAASQDGTRQLSAALGESVVANFELAARVSSLESLVAQLEREGVSPREAVTRLIDGMNERDLESSVGLITRMSEAELDEIDDIRAFARRLSEIAIEGTLETPADADAWDDAGIVLFSDEKDIDDPEAYARDEFGAETERIWAMVPVGGAGGERITVKWARTDRPEIIRLKRRRIDPGEEWAAFFIMSAEPRDAGEYQVSVFTGDDAMDQIAMGTYRVVDDS